jgi:hypothetical protein
MNSGTCRVSDTRAKVCLRIIRFDSGRHKLDTLTHDLCRNDFALSAERLSGCLPANQIGCTEHATVYRTTEVMIWKFTITTQRHLFASKSRVVLSGRGARELEQSRCTASS